MNRPQANPCERENRWLRAYFPRMQMSRCYYTERSGERPAVTNIPLYRRD